jgi:hypothetical protein
MTTGYERWVQPERYVRGRDANLQHCVIVSYAQADRVVGPFDNLDEAETWIANNKSDRWLGIIALPMERPTLSDE